MQETQTLEASPEIVRSRGCDCGRPSLTPLQDLTEGGLRVLTSPHYRKQCLCLPRPCSLNAGSASHNSNVLAVCGVTIVNVECFQLGLLLFKLHVLRLGTHSPRRAGYDGLDGDAATKSCKQTHWMAHHIKLQHSISTF